MNNDLVKDVDELAAGITDGAKLAIFKEGVPMAAVRALIRRGVRDLHLIGVPTNGLAADMLIGAGCVAVIESSGITMGEYGQAPCFGRAVREGAVRPLDSTCPAVYTGLQAGEKGIPFMPMRGLIGSDILAKRPDYRVIDNPFAADDPIVAIPAIKPDVALIHAPLADRYGNVWIGRQHELKIMAHAARRTLVSCERLYDGNLLEDEQLAAAAISSLYIDAIALAEHGCQPLALPGYYTEDVAAIAEYMDCASDQAGFDDWLRRSVLRREAAA